MLVLNVRVVKKWIWIATIYLCTGASVYSKPRAQTFISAQYAPQLKLCEKYLSTHTQALKNIKGEALSASEAAALWSFDPLLDTPVVRERWFDWDNMFAIYEAHLKTTFLGPHQKELLDYYAACAKEKNETCHGVLATQKEEALYCSGVALQAAMDFWAQSVSSIVNACQNPKGKFPEKNGSYLYHEAFARQCLSGKDVPTPLTSAAEIEKRKKEKLFCVGAPKETCWKKSEQFILSLQKKFNSLNERVVCDLPIEEPKNKTVFTDVFQKIGEELWIKNHPEVEAQIQRGETLKKGLDVSGNVLGFGNLSEAYEAYNQQFSFLQNTIELKALGITKRKVFEEQINFFDTKHNSPPEFSKVLSQRNSTRVESANFFGPRSLDVDKLSLKTLKVVANGIVRNQFYFSVQAYLIRSLRKSSPWEGEKIISNQTHFSKWAHDRICAHSELKHVFCSSAPELPIQKLKSNLIQDLWVQVPHLKKQGFFKFDAEEDQGKQGPIKRVYTKAFYAGIKGKMEDINAFCSQNKVHASWLRKKTVDQNHVIALNEKLKNFFVDKDVAFLMGYDLFLKNIGFDVPWVQTLSTQVGGLSFQSLEQKCFQTGAVFGKAEPFFTTYSSVPLSMGNTLSLAVNEADVLPSLLIRARPFLLKNLEDPSVKGSLDWTLDQEFKDLKVVLTLSSRKDITTFLENSASRRIMAVLKYALDDPLVSNKHTIPGNELGQIIRHLLDKADIKQKKDQQVAVGLMLVSGATLSYALIGPLVGLAGFSSVTSSLVGLSLVGGGFYQYGVQSKNNVLQKSLIEQSVASGVLDGKHASSFLIQFRNDQKEANVYFFIDALLTGFQGSKVVLRTLANTEKYYKNLKLSAQAQLSGLKWIAPEAHQALSWRNPIIIEKSKTIDVRKLSQGASGDMHNPLDFQKVRNFLNNPKLLSDEDFLKLMEKVDTPEGLKLLDDMYMQAWNSIKTPGWIQSVSKGSQTISKNINPKATLPSEEKPAQALHEPLWKQTLNTRPLYLQRLQWMRLGFGLYRNNPNMLRTIHERLTWGLDKGFISVDEAKSWAKTFNSMAQKAFWFKRVRQKVYTFLYRPKNPLPAYKMEPFLEVVDAVKPSIRYLPGVRVAHASESFLRKLKIKNGTLAQKVEDLFSSDRIENYELDLFFKNINDDQFIQRLVDHGSTVDQKIEMLEWMIAFNRRKFLGTTAMEFTSGLKSWGENLWFHWESFLTGKTFGDYGGFGNYMGAKLRNLKDNWNPSGIPNRLHRYFFASEETLKIQMKWFDWSQKTQNQIKNISRLAESFTDESSRISKLIQNESLEMKKIFDDLKRMKKADAANTLAFNNKIFRRQIQEYKKYRKHKTNVSEAWDEAANMANRYRAIRQGCSTPGAAMNMANANFGRLAEITTILGVMYAYYARGGLSILTPIDTTMSLLFAQFQASNFSHAYKSKLAVMATDWVSTWPTEMADYASFTYLYRGLILGEKQVIRDLAENYGDAQTMEELKQKLMDLTQDRFSVSERKWFQETLERIIHEITSDPSFMDALGDQEKFWNAVMNTPVTAKDQVFQNTQLEVELNPKMEVNVLNDQDQERFQKDFLEAIYEFGIYEEAYKSKKERVNIAKGWSVKAWDLPDWIQTKTQLDYLENQFQINIPRDQSVERTLWYRLDQDVWVDIPFRGYMMSKIIYSMLCSNPQNPILANQIAGGVYTLSKVFFLTFAYLMRDDVIHQ